MGNTLKVTILLCLKYTVQLHICDCTVTLKTTTVLKIAIFCLKLQFLRTCLLEIIIIAGESMDTILKESNNIVCPINYHKSQLTDFCGFIYDDELFFTHH